MKKLQGREFRALRVIVTKDVIAFGMAEITTFRDGQHCRNNSVPADTSPLRLYVNFIVNFITLRMLLHANDQPRITQSLLDKGRDKLRPLCC
jgi:hypothetical protein